LLTGLLTLIQKFIERRFHMRQRPAAKAVLAEEHG